MAHREVLNEQSRKLVLNVLEYFQNKKETSTENISVINCAAEALELSPRTISRIRHEGPRETPVPAKRKASKTRDLPEGVKSAIRTVIYTMIENKQFVTRENLRLELLNRQVIDVSNTTLGIILKGLGFRFSKDNGRRALLERPEIASKLNVTPDFAKPSTSSGVYSHISGDFLTNYAGLTTETLKTENDFDMIYEDIKPEIFGENSGVKSEKKSYSNPANDIWEQK